MTDRRFLVEGPAIINVSGGRTSGMMLHHILDAHDGKLPSNVFAAFANTGREMPATLDFVAAMELHWGVHIQWLEYRRDPETGRQWAEPVSHNSASRDGEPFDMLLQARGYMLPGPKMRFCTEELKLRTIHRWVKTNWAGGCIVATSVCGSMNCTGSKGSRSTTRPARAVISVHARSPRRG